MLWENYRNDGTLFFSLQRKLEDFEGKSEQKQILQVTIATFFATAHLIYFSNVNRSAAILPHFNFLIMFFTLGISPCFTIKMQ